VIKKNHPVGYQKLQPDLATAWEFNSERARFKKNRLLTTLYYNHVA